MVKRLFVGWLCLVFAWPVFAGIYYLEDGAGYVTRHEGDTPYPPGAVWAARCPRDADERTLSVVDGVVAVDLAKASAVQEEAAAAARLPRQEPTGIEAPHVVLLSESNKYGIAISATDEGDLVTWVMHQSPVDWERANSNKVAALEKRRLDRQTAKDGINGQLQRRIENLERLLGLRE